LLDDDRTIFASADIVSRYSLLSNIIAGNTAPFAGAVMLTVGSAFTAMATAAEVLAPPKLSVATAVRLPAGTPVQVMAYGAAVTVVISTPSW
jgi:hypothetical protein